jgi:hypothetical protein
MNGKFGKAVGVYGDFGEIERFFFRFLSAESEFFWNSSNKPPRSNVPTTGATDSYFQFD